MRTGKHNFIRRGGKGLSLTELVIAMAIMVIIMAAIMPQFRAIRNSWASSEASANMIQNGRVLEEHIIRNLSSAKQLVSVSSSSTTNGFIIFKDVADIQKRYMVSGGYVVFGNLGSEEQLAGPVSKFQVSCYSLDDINTPITDANNIRLVEVETDFTNSNPMGTDRTFIASAYLQTNANMGCDLVGWWKLDETSGTTAADSSGNGNNGTLINMTSPGCWTTTGLINGALVFDGTDDFVQAANISNYLGTNYSVSWWAKSNQISTTKELILLGNDSTAHDFEYYQSNANLCVRADTGSSDDITVNNVFAVDQWVHICGVGDSDGTRVYVNGTLAGTTSIKKNTTTGYNLNIGAYPSGANSFNGTIDDVRIYNRALTTAEILQLYNTLRYISMGFTEFKQGSDTNSVTISTPATNTGDLLIAAVATDGDNSTTITTAAAGWTRIDRGTDAGGQVTLGAWYKIAGTSESAPTFTWPAGNLQQAYGWMMQFRGNDTNPATVINDSNPDQSSVQYPTSPAVTTDVDNCIILRLGAFDGNGITLDSPGLSGHTAITMDASGSSASTGPVAILGSWTQNAAHAKEAGTNRALVFTAHAMRNGSISLTSVTYGGQAMTKIAEAVNGASGRIYTAVFILNDAGVSAATGSPPAFALTWSHSPTNSAYSSVFLQNVNQTTMTGATAKDETAVGATITTSALANSAGDMVIEAATSNAAGTYTANNGFTNALEITITSKDGMAGYKSATGASETPSVTHTNATVHSLIGFVVKTAGGPGTVSGGAGYVKQSTAGSSGTSNFTLGSSNEARALTIAIAPDSTSDDGCSGGITP